MRDWWLYVNKETLQICRVSSILEEEDQFHLIKIDEELGTSFIDKPHTLFDYVVYFDGTKAHFIKKDKSKEVVVPFFYSPLILNKEVEDADIQFAINDGKLFVAINPKLKQYAMTMYAHVDPSKQKVEVYVSAKNDPNYLYEIIKVDMLALINQGFLSFDFNHDPKRVSLFTRKIFDSYSLKQ